MSLNEFGAIFSFSGMGFLLGLLVAGRIEKYSWGYTLSMAGLSLMCLVMALVNWFIL